jgi:hypothetical protein
VASRVLLSSAGFLTPTYSILLICKKLLERMHWFHQVARGVRGESPEPVHTEEALHQRCGRPPNCLQPRRSCEKCRFPWISAYRNSQAKSSQTLDGKTSWCPSFSALSRPVPLAPCPSILPATSSDDVHSDLWAVCFVSCSSNCDWNMQRVRQRGHFRRKMEPQVTAV